MTTPRPRFARARLAAAAFVTLAAVLAACESRLPTSAELEGMDVATVEDRLELRADSVNFYVNDLLVTAGEARAIDAATPARSPAVLAIHRFALPIRGRFTTTRARLDLRMRPRSPLRMKTVFY